MTKTTVAEFAKELKKSPDTLLEQLKSAGVPKGSVCRRTDRCRQTKVAGFLKGQLTELTRLSVKKSLWSRNPPVRSNKPMPPAKLRTIQVEVRKKRTFVKRDENESTESEAPVLPAVHLLHPSWTKPSWLVEKKRPDDKPSSFADKKKSSLKNVVCDKRRKIKIARRNNRPQSHQPQTPRPRLPLKWPHKLLPNVKLNPKPKPRKTQPKPKTWIPDAELHWLKPKLFAP
jgi:translation initiation factor IF-2